MKQPTHVLHTFYRPHKRVTYSDDIVNAVTGEVSKPERRVKQSFVPECDINNILKQYSATGQLKHINAKAQTGAYQDLPDEIDFQTSLNIVQQGRDAFATLPSKTRDRFGNDPANFLEFLADSKNAEEAIKLGLATAREQPQAPRTPAGPPPEPEGSKNAPEGKK
ncbi:MAG: internal scaffolding protein [Microviridae sp.]|nr:MAG: internal scaffolding protein [Microviridae sp.]